MTVIPESRLCCCGHIYHVHRPGPCNVVQGCDCAGFREETRPFFEPAQWLKVAGYRPQQAGRETREAA